MKPTLTLRLTTGWWQQIREGSKHVELRLATPRYRKRLLNRDYGEIHLWLGYPPAEETSKRMRFRWRGARLVTMQHLHFGPDPVELIEVDLSDRLEIPPADQLGLF